MSRGSILRDLVVWVGFPFGLLCAALAAKALLPAPEAPSRSMVFQNWGQDRKLRRTLRQFDSPSSSDSSLGVIDITDRPGFRIDIGVDEEQRLHLARTEKWNDKLQDEKLYVPISFEGGAVGPARIKVHGDSTVGKERKSLSVELFNAALEANGHDLQRFFLLGLQHDRGEFRMVYGYRLLQREGLFPSFHLPVTVFINDEPQGIYLLVERPVDAIMREHPEVASIYRRRTRSSLELKYQGAATDPLVTMGRVRFAADDGDDEQAYDALRQWVNLGQFFTWLALNSLLMNGDTVDELYIYELRGRLDTDRKLNFVAWDYEDLMEPYDRNRKIVDDPFIYGADADLEMRVGEDEILNQEFRRTLRRLVETVWTEEAMLREFDDVKSMLDAIDSGYAPEIDAEIRMRREEQMRAFRDQIVARHAKIRALLDEHQVPFEPESFAHVPDNP